MLRKTIYKKRIRIVYLQGGLGNQLFQYAFSRALEESLNCEVKYDLDFFKGQNERKFCLDKFNLDIKEASNEEKRDAQELKLSLVQRMKNIINKQTVFNPLCLENPLGYKREYLLKKHKLYYLGFWQSEKYFSNIRETIRLELSNLIAPSNVNLRTIDTLSIDQNSVSLHIRRGDYVLDENTTNFHGFCGLEYYQRAFDLLIEKIGVCNLYVFSDDFKWAKRYLNFPCKIVFVDWNSDETNHEDLRLMSLCKHNIIANSSFSWWGAWLNNNPNKIVIAPRNWFAQPEENKRAVHLLPSDWLKV